MTTFPCLSLQIRLQLSGRHPTLPTRSGDDGFGIARVTVFGQSVTCDGPSQTPSCAETLSQLQMWLSGTAKSATYFELQASQSAPVAEAYDASISALANLARVSGSLSSVLLLASSLLAVPVHRKLSSHTASAISRLMLAIRQQVRLF